ncbi:MAG: hypothetical protein M1830_007460 [Pleopsidium flavum]|nr:MAG: hypothetical protein M1830_007460 [Pleopsidium flavum]
MAAAPLSSPKESRDAPAPPANTPPSVSIGYGDGHFAHVDGRLFNIDGKTQYFAGTNTWWLAHLSSNDDVDKVLARIAATELKVTRVWGFGNVNTPTTGSVYFQVLNESLSSTGQYINYDESTGIPRLDYVVSAAERYGVKLVLPMLNNWDDLGGINTYTNAFGGSATSFYTDSQSQAAYRNYIEFIVNRYKSSSAIFAWELCNEPRCRGCSSSTISDWASATSAYIKSLDSNHMVTLGDEGWFYPPEGDGSYAYSGYEGVDFVKNLAIQTLDYGTFHMYPDSWGYNFTWGNTWIEQHDQAGAAAGKPVVLEEYGSPYPDNHTAITQPWQQTVLTQTRIGYDSFWQFGTDLSSGRSPFDQYAIFSDTSDYQTLAVQHAKDMLAKSP